MQGTQTNAPAGTTSTGAAAAASKGNVPLNSITAGGVYTGHVTERTTFATVGMGQVEVGGELLTTENSPLVNRDVANTQVITRDQDIGGLNASMTVDGRWFTKDGRAEMAQQKIDIGKNSKQVAGGVAQDLMYITGTHSAYEVMFTKEAKMYVLEYTEDGSVKKDENGIPLRREVSDEESGNLVHSSDGKVYVANNGIFNDQDGAAKYANQHNIEREDDEPVSRVQYFIEFPQADNLVSELLVAGYQKFIEGDF